jgi:mono/diheme cytochrome c family protein
MTYLFIFLTSKRAMRSWPVAVLCFAPAWVLAQTFSPLDQSGEELFGRYCAACHGAGARGDGPVASTLNKRVPDLTVLARNAGGDFPALVVRETIDGRSMMSAHGTRQMPVWGYEFWVEEGADIVAESTASQLIDRIVAYLASVQIVADQLVGV